MQKHRRRRHVSQGAFRLVRPAFRYSPTRQAWVLRGVGRHVGPVLKPPPKHFSPF